MARYEEIANELRQQIEAGTYAPGDRLPRYAELCERYGVGRGVVASALDVLQREGLVRTVKRLGTVVQPRTPRRRVTRGSTVTRNPATGYVFPAASSPGERWQSHGRPVRSMQPAPVPVAEAFGVEVGSEVLRRRRVMSPEGEVPFQLVDTWISPDGVADAPQVAEISTGPGGYLDRLEEAGHGPISWTETIRARMPTAEEARLLNIPAALPVLETIIIGTSARTQRPIEVTMRVIPSDRVELVSDLRRAASAAWPRQSEGEG